MPIRFDTDKCWIRDPDSLRIKRYLSETRSYFREGRWIRECFQSFFPGIRTDEEGYLFYDFSTLHPPIQAVRAACLEDTKIPEALLDQFQDAIEQFMVRTNEGGLHFNEETASREFTLPDPEAHPELYWVAQTETGLRLIVLWGLQSDQQAANLRIEALVEKLIFQFEGRPTLKRMDSDDDALEAEAMMERANDTVVASPLQEGRAKAPVPASQVRRRGSRTLWRSVGAVFLIAFGLVGFSELSHHMVGATITVMPSTPPKGGPDGVSFQLESGESVITPDGTHLEARDQPINVVVSRLAKPGRALLEVRQSDTLDFVRSFSTTFNPHRDDMLQGPVASLQVNRNRVVTGESVVATVDRSFHEQEAGELAYFLSWGKPGAPFESVTQGSRSASHSYENPGRYEVYLLTLDPDGNWDYDLETITVVSDPAQLPAPTQENLPPIAHASLAHLYPHEGVIRAVLDLSKSWDPDGSVAQIEVDWGDGSDPEFVPFPHSWLVHDYRRRNNRITLRIHAHDTQGARSMKPVQWFLDFQSATMNRTMPPAHTLEDPAVLRWIESGPTQLRLMQRTGTQLLRHQQPLQFVLIPPANQPFAPLLDVQWALYSSTGIPTVRSGGFQFDLRVAEGRYRLVTTARTPDGTVLTREHRFSVRTDDQLNPVFRAMHWWNTTVPFLRPSRHLHSNGKLPMWIQKSRSKSSGSFDD